jgi:hypothetical protein
MIDQYKITCDHNIKIISIINTRKLILIYSQKNEPLVLGMTNNMIKFLIRINNFNLHIIVLILRRIMNKCLQLIFDKTIQIKINIKIVISNKIETKIAIIFIQIWPIDLYQSRINNLARIFKNMLTDTVILKIIAAKIFEIKSIVKINYKMKIKFKKIIINLSKNRKWKVKKGYIIKYRMMKKVVNIPIRN